MTSKKGKQKKGNKKRETGNCFPGKQGTVSLGNRETAIWLDQGKQGNKEKDFSDM